MRIKPRPAAALPKAVAPIAGAPAMVREWPALLSVALVEQYTSLSKSTIWRGVSAETFPSPVQCGGRTLWVRSHVDAWIEDLSPTK